MEGTEAEMGRQYAESFSDRSMLDYFLRFPATYNDRHMPSRFASWLGTRTFSYVMGRMSRNYDARERSFGKAFADSLDISPQTIRRALTMPDAYLYLLTRLGQLRNIPFIPMGCASFIVRNSRTRSGGTVHGRNLDFFAGKQWGRSHEVQVRRPKEGLASVTVSAEGINAPGVTSVNEAGLTLAVHMMFSSKVSLRREPILSAAARAIRTCRNVSELRTFVEKLRVSVGWAFVAGDADGNASVFEMHAGDSRELVARAEKITCTNGYRSDLSLDESIPVVGLSQSNQARQSRMEDVIKSIDEPFDAVSAMKVMQDSFDLAMNRETSAGHTVANNFTVSSAAFDFRGDTLAVGHGVVPAPFGPVSTLRLSSLFEGREEVMATMDRTESSDDIAQARRSFIEAGWGWSDDTALDEIAENLGLAFDTDETEPAYPLFLAVFRIRQGRMEEAVALAGRAAEQYPDSYRTGLALLIQGMAMDLAGRRDEALERYADIVKSHPYDDLVGTARRYVDRSPKMSDIRMMEPNWFTSLILML